MKVLLIERIRALLLSIKLKQFSAFKTSARKEILCLVMAPKAELVIPQVTRKKLTVLDVGLTVGIRQLLTTLQAAVN